MGRGGQAAFDDDALAAVRRDHLPLYTTITDDEGVTLRVYTRPMPDGGAGQAAYPLTDAYRALAGLNRALLLLMPVALIAAGFVGAALTDRVLRRVRAMTRAAARIGARDLAERLPADGDDEFSDLATTFNGLLGRLETAFTRQQRLVEQQRRFTADASHELKTPLTVIKGNTSMLLAGRPGEATYRESVGEIDRAANTMGKLVQDLLLLARSDEGRLGQGRIELLAREVLERAVARVPHGDGTAPIRLAIEGEPTLRGGEDELTRMVANLLDNALRHTPPDGTVTLGARREGASVVLTIVDTGSGIAPEHLAHVGERFYRADAARARADGGTGLGLAICRAIAEAHGGTLAIRSAPGNGTTVTVTLPSGAPPSPPPPLPMLGQE
jgi:signal transduction histidine kinase